MCPHWTGHPKTVLDEQGKSPSRNPKALRPSEGGVGGGREAGATEEPDVSAAEAVVYVGRAGRILPSAFSQRGNRLGSASRIVVIVIGG